MRIVLRCGFRLHIGGLEGTSRAKGSTAKCVCEHVSVNVTMFQPMQHVSKTMLRVPSGCVFVTQAMWSKTKSMKKKNQKTITNSASDGIN